MARFSGIACQDNDVVRSILPASASTLWAALLAVMPVSNSARDKIQIYGKQNFD